MSLDAWVKSDAYAGPPELGPFIAALRRLNDAAVRNGPPPEVLASLTGVLEKAAGELSAYPLANAEIWATRRADLPGGGHPLLVPIDITITDGALTGDVTFTAAYVGGNGAVHGGAIPLLFDDVLGRLCNRVSMDTGAIARTAYLRVNYRRVTPIDTPLRMEGSVDRREGRKIFATLRLLDVEGHVLADAEGLFVTLRTGAP